MMSVDFRLNPRPHSLHTIGFSPECAFWCLARLFFRLKPFSHTPHTYGFSPECILWWLSRFVILLKPSPHSPQLTVPNPKTSILFNNLSVSSGLSVWAGVASVSTPLMPFLELTNCLWGGLDNAVKTLFFVFPNEGLVPSLSWAFALSLQQLGSEVCCCFFWFPWHRSPGWMWFSAHKQGKIQGGLRHSMCSTWNFWLEKSGGQKAQRWSSGFGSPAERRVRGRPETQEGNPSNSAESDGETQFPVLQNA